jgi:hypothetical protein
MLRRSLLIAGISLLPALGSSRKARAQLSIQEARAATLPTVSSPHVNRSMEDADQQRIHSLMLKDGYKLRGDMRRKGQMFTMVAEREGIAWRLVVDGVSGELIGRKMVGYPAGQSD